MNQMKGLEHLRTFFTLLSDIASDLRSSKSNNCWASFSVACSGQRIFTLSVDEGGNYKLFDQGGDVMYSLVGDVQCATNTSLFQACSASNREIFTPLLFNCYGHSFT
jgi:hypothetical protein